MSLYSFINDILIKHFVPDTTFVSICWFVNTYVLRHQWPIGDWKKSCRRGYSCHAPCSPSSIWPHTSTPRAPSCPTVRTRCHFVIQNTFWNGVIQVWPTIVLYLFSFKRLLGWWWLASGCGGGRPVDEGGHPIRSDCFYASNLNRYLIGGLEDLLFIRPNPVIRFKFISH